MNKTIYNSWINKINSPIGSRISNSTLDIVNTQSFKALYSTNEWKPITVLQNFNSWWEENNELLLKNISIKELEIDEVEEIDISTVFDEDNVKFGHNLNKWIQDMATYINTLDSNKVLNIINWVIAIHSLFMMLKQDEKPNVINVYGGSPTFHFEDTRDIKINMPSQIKKEKHQNINDEMKNLDFTAGDRT